MINNIEWIASPFLVPYPEALAQMDRYVKEIQDGRRAETIWLLEHPSLYTAGSSARPQDLLSPDRFPVYNTGRGGQLTYHGPGQRIGYVILNLNHRGQDLRRYIRNLGLWLEKALVELGVDAYTHPERIGIWVRHGDTELKIAAIGVRVQKWVTSHGFALNVHPALEHFGGIVPCGLRTFGVTSLHELGIKVSFSEVDRVLKETFKVAF